MVCFDLVGRLGVLNVMCKEDNGGTLKLVAFHFPKRVQQTNFFRRLETLSKFVKKNLVG